MASIDAILDRDTGVYLYVGQVIAGGGMPYVDAADNKGPLTFLLFTGIQAVAGDSATAVRVCLLLALVIAACALALYTRTFGSDRIAFLAGMSLAVLGSTVALEGNDPNTEQFGIAPMVIAWYLAAQRSSRAAAGAGAVSGLAVMMNLGFAAVAPIVVFELIRSSRRRGQAWKRLLAAGGAGALVCLAFAGWLAAGHALDDLIAQAGAQALGGTSSASLSERISLGRLTEFPALGLFAVGTCGALVGLRDRHLSPLGLGALIWIVVMWARVQLSGYDQAEQLYYLAIPGIALGTALGMGVLLRARATLPSVAVAGTALALIGYYVVAPQIRSLSTGPWPDDPDLALVYPVADFVEASTSAGQSVFFAGSIAQGYWLSNRRAPTRFFHSFPVSFQETYSDERRSDLISSPPAAIAELPGAAKRERGPPVVPDLLAHKPYRLAYERNGARVWLLSDRDAESR
ncbi:MAG: 6-pyruvoyl-tetrahydropterin synthase-related protein [Solirubrobacterales bacterium]